MKVALIQQKYHNSKEKMVLETLKAVERASDSGAKLVVLQELHQSEYFCQSENTEYFKYASTFKDDLKLWSNVAERE